MTGVWDPTTPLLDGVSDEALGQVIADFYERMLADERVARYFENINMARLRAHQRSFLLAAFSEPAFVNQEQLVRAHSTLGVTHEEYDIAVGHLGASLLGAGVPEAQVDAIAARVDRLRPLVVAANGHAKTG